MAFNQGRTSEGRKMQRERERNGAASGGRERADRKQRTKEGKEDIKDMSQGLHQHPRGCFPLTLFTAPDGLGL